MKTNITAMLLGAVLLALVGCMDFGAGRLLIEAIDNETNEYKTVPIHQKTIYDTDIPIPAKGVSRDQIWYLYGPENFKYSSSGFPELYTHAVYYVSESGTLPLKAFFFKYIHELSSPGLSMGYAVCVRDGKVIFTYHGYMDPTYYNVEAHLRDVNDEGEWKIPGPNEDPGNVLRQTIYELPPEHLSNGVEIRPVNYNDMWERNPAGNWIRLRPEGSKPDGSWRRTRMQGSHKFDGDTILPSHFDRIEVYHPLDKSYPLMMQIRFVLSEPSPTRSISIVKWSMVGNLVIFRLYQEEDLYTAVEEWRREAPEFDRDVGLDIGVDIRLDYTWDRLYPGLNK